MACSQLQSRNIFGGKTSFLAELAHFVASVNCTLNQHRKTSQRYAAGKTGERLAQAADGCDKQAEDKKLAGAAKTSFVKKCSADAVTASPAAASCEKAAGEKKLAGAAKTSSYRAKAHSGLPEAICALWAIVGMTVPSLRALLARAERTGKPANGYTTETLREKIATFERMSTATDAEVITNTRQTADRMRARLAELRRGA